MFGSWPELCWRWAPHVWLMAAVRRGLAIGSRGDAMADVDVRFGPADSRRAIEGTDRGVGWGCKIRIA